MVTPASDSLSRNARAVAGAPGVSPWMQTVAALTDSAMRSHLTDAELVGIPIESPHVVSTLCLAQSAKKKATPLIRKTSLALRELSQQVCAPL